jgi:hypothetical protein
MILTQPAVVKTRSHYRTMQSRTQRGQEGYGPGRIVLRYAGPQQFCCGLSRQALTRATANLGGSDSESGRPGRACQQQSNGHPKITIIVTIEHSLHEIKRLKQRIAGL